MLRVLKVEPKQIVFILKLSILLSIQGSTLLRYSQWNILYTIRYLNSFKNN